MAVRVLMPTFGLTEGEATITRWCKRVGDSVVADEPLFEAESEKASLEVPAPQSGVLLRVLTAEGAVAPLGEVVAWIGNPDEQHSVGEELIHTSVTSALSVPDAVSVPNAAPPPDATTAVSAPRLKASPIARRMAREHGIDLTSLQGSGPGSRIVEADVRRVLSAPRGVVHNEPRTVETVEVEAMATAATSQPSTDRLPLTPLRRITAERLAASARAVVAVPLFIKADMSEVQRLRSLTRAEYEARFGTACSYNAIILRACALALPEWPALNGKWTQEGVAVGREVNVGLAVAVEDGLLVPVIHQAEQKRLMEIQAELNTLIPQAQARSLPPQAFANGTFTVTNLGHMGIDAFVPTINLPQTGILGVGRVADEVVVVNGQPAVRPMVTLCLVFDHRAIDGAPAASCLARLKQLLENPYLLA